MIKGTSVGNAVSGKDAAPGIWLAPDKNNLLISTSVLGRKPQVCDVANIPIQKWVHVAYVLDNRTVDVYVDCKLERSCVLTGVPLLNNQKLYLFPQNTSSPGGSGTTDGQTGFLGQLSSLRYFSQALRPVDVARICNEGPHATKGAPSKDHHPDSGGGGKCPPVVYRDLRKVKRQLVTITDEVNDALNAEQKDRHHKYKQWDILVKSDQPPRVTRINGGGGDNVPGGGQGWKCDTTHGTCSSSPSFNPGTLGVYDNPQACNQNCYATGFNPQKKN